MPYVFLSLAVLCSASLSITAIVFNKKNSTQRNLSGLYNLIVTLSSFSVWAIVFLTSHDFSPKVLLYSAGFALFYVMAFIGLFKALESGSPSITSFIKQLSLIVVALWGFIFWKNPVADTVITGLVLVLVSLYFCFRPSKGEKTSAKWLAYSFLLLLGNAGCSIVQKYQQIHFEGKCGNLLMFCATGFSALLCLIIYLKGERPKIREFSRFTAFLPIVAGASSALLNVFVLRLIASHIPESVFFPIIGVGGIILTTLFSVGVYKEKLTKYRWTGLLIGLVAIVFLNL